MGNVNRMLVTEHQSHTTEERLIEDKMQDGIKTLKNLATELDEMLFAGQWGEAGYVAKHIGTATDYMAKLAYRLEDVKGINAQFARIQEHIDRLEAQLTTEGKPNEKTTQA